MYEFVERIGRRNHRGVFSINNCKADSQNHCYDTAYNHQTAYDDRSSDYNKADYYQTPHNHSSAHNYTAYDPQRLWHLRFMESERNNNRKGHNQSTDDHKADNNETDHNNTS